MQANRIGRPTKVAQDRVALGCRVRPEIKNRLDAEAQVAGRSQSQEVEMILERHFEQQDAFDKIAEMFGGKETLDIVALVGRKFCDAGKLALFALNRSTDPRAWLDHPYAYDEALKAAVGVLESLRPKTDPEELAKDAIKADATKAAFAAAVKEADAEKRPRRKAKKETGR